MTLTSESFVEWARRPLEHFYILGMSTRLRDVMVVISRGELS